MLDLERQKQNFKNHVAKFTDYGNIKILDFQRPGEGNYRIRFLFEEDFCRLHISGDLGHLIATNYNNMCWAKFPKDFSNNPGYFEGKVECHDRYFYTYDEGLARDQLIQFFDEMDISEVDIMADYGEAMEEFLGDVIDCLDPDTGLSQEGTEILLDGCGGGSMDIYEMAASLGKQRTGIIELYLLAFRLAYEQITAKKEDNK